ncbi:MAG: ParB/RepB/Spo0J family partition protein [Legionellales bacterium]|nr:ParB/RepB/Spo0J family partition protein [Legionellales bacterium]
MVVKRGGLGRNLSALLTHTDTSLLVADAELGVEPTKLAIHCLTPGKYQPRIAIDDASVLELSESIKKQGLLQPLVVREVAQGRYEILAGERRWRACQLAGMSHIPVVVRQVDDETAMAIALVENLQRQDLNAMEQARAMHRLTTEFGLTHQQIADLLSKSRTAVTNFLRLLNLCSEVRHMLEQGLLEMGHARCLLMLDETQQLSVAQRVIDKQLSVREAELWVARVKDGGGGHVVPTKTTMLTPSVDSALQTLAHQLRTKVFIKPGKAGKGTLMIHYDDFDALQQMIGQLIE